MNAPDSQLLERSAALLFGEKSALVSRQTARYMSSLMGPLAPIVEVPEAQHHVMLDHYRGRRLRLDRCWRWLARYSF